MDNYLNVMRARREQLLERFYAALDRAGRPRDAARLIAVSKTGIVRSHRLPGRPRPVTGSAFHISRR